MNTRLVWVLTVLLLLAIAGVLAYNNLAPEVVAFSPQESLEYYPRNTEIEITFSRPMDPDSVRSRLSILPAVAGNFTWEDETLRFTPSVPWESGSEVTVHLGRGAKSSLGLSTRQDSAWAFTVSPTLLAYLWPAEGGADVYVLEPTSGEATQLTHAGSVLSYDVSADGRLIYYSAMNKQGGSDLFVLERFSGDSRMVHSCGTELCTEIDLSPDGTMLAFQRKDSEIWLLRLDGGKAERRSRWGHESRLPGWSPDGHLCYYDADLEAFIVLNPETGEQITLYNNIGETGDWSPGGTRFVAPETYTEESDILRGPTGEASNQPVDENTLEPVRLVISHLTAYNVDTGEITSLTKEDYTEDFTPAFSPDGSRLDFARRYLDEDRWTPGRQAWLLQVNSGETHVLTHAPDYKYIAFAWHPDGDQVAAVRFNTTVLIDPPELWLLHLDGSGYRLVIGGYAPQWIP
jgi:dipeptidyl aminopeptidase/acylaminoacyl peptidase